jgi:NitT/TauT family transport system substrate-binding protein
MAYGATKIATVVCLAVIAAATSACTDSGGTADGDSVSIIQTRGVLNYVVDNVAQTEGYFERQGLDVKINYGGGDVVTDPAVLSGGDDFGIGGTLPLFKYAGSGKAPTIVAAVDDQLPQEIGINKSVAERLGIKPGMSLAQKFARVKGHALDVGVSDVGGSAQLTYEAVAGHFGLKEGDGYRVTGIGSYPSLIVALDDDRVDMAVFGIPYGSQAVSEGKSVDFTDLWKGSYPPYAGTIFGALFTSASYAKAHPATVRKMHTAIAEALNFIHQHPTKALADIDKADPGTPTQVLHTMVVTDNSSFLARSADVDPRAYRTTQQLAARTIAPDANKIDYSDLVWSGARSATGS